MNSLSWPSRLGAFVSFALAACSGSGTGTRDASLDGAHDARPADAAPCTTLACRQVQCTAGTSTTLSGVVTIPSGTLPLYGATVYVPQGPLDPVVNGATCDRCDAPLSGNPLVRTTTDERGHFALENVPTGADVPLVIQLGKWRRQITVPSVASCMETPLDGTMTHLPRNASEGDMPRIALTTGGADPLECLLRKVGIDQSEFTPESGSGHVNFFTGNGGTSSYDTTWNAGARFTPATTLWGTTGTLMPYDLVLLACEGGQDAGNKPATARQAMHDYVGMGGRVFASHWQNYWLEQGPAPFPDVATFVSQPDLADPFTAQIDTSFPKGMAFATWLQNATGSTSFGTIVIHAGQHTVDGVNATYSQRWIYSDTPNSTQYFTFNTPADALPANQCGRVVFSDIHVASDDRVNRPFPTGCTTTTLSAQEMALIFMLFDLSACITQDAPG